MGINCIHTISSGATAVTPAGLVIVFDVGPEWEYYGTFILPSGTTTATRAGPVLLLLV